MFLLSSVNNMLLDTYIGMRASDLDTNAGFHC